MCFSLKRFLSILVMSLMLSACSDEPVKRLSVGDNILAFGDSLTYGVGASRGEDYPAQLARLVGFEVNNFGISGETTTEGLIRFKDALAETQPELVILLEGGNDILRNQNLQQTKLNLSKMIAIAQNSHIPVLLIGVPNKSLFLSDASFYGELAEEYSLLYIEDAISDLLKQPQYKSDTIHLNDEGYRILAKTIKKALTDSGLIF